MKRAGTASILKQIRDLLDEQDPDIQQIIDITKTLLIQGPCTQELAEIKATTLAILERLILPALTGNRTQQTTITNLIRTIRKNEHLNIVDLLTQIETIAPWIETIATYKERGEEPPPFQPEIAIASLETLGAWNQDEINKPDAQSLTIAECWHELYRLSGRLILREQRAHSAWARDKKELQEAIATWAGDLVESSLIIGRKESASETWVREMADDILIKPESVMTALLTEESAFWQRTREVETALNQSQKVITQFQTLLRQAENALMDTRDETLVDLYTGLPNRFAFMARLAQAMEPLPGKKNPPAPFTVIFIRIDEYLEMIQSLGRDRINRVVSALASKIATQIPPETYLTRWNEESFALLSPNFQTTEAVELATTLQNSLNPVQFELADALVTLRLGFGVIPHQPDMTEEHLLALAESKAIDALQEGANPIQVAEIQPPTPPEPSKKRFLRKKH